MDAASFFYKPSKKRGVVPCPQWRYFPINEIKVVVVRLVGPPVRSPKGRYAIHCFDRRDGQFRILEGPHVLFEQFAMYDRSTNCNPSGPDAPDFRIVLAAVPFRYFVSPLSVQPLTDTEKVAMVGDMLNLGKIYSTGTDMHIVEVAASLGLWPKPLWPTEYQKRWNAATSDQLAAQGIVIRLPSEQDMMAADSRRFRVGK